MVIRYVVIARNGDSLFYKKKTRSRPGARRFDGKPFRDWTTNQEFAYFYSRLIDAEDVVDNHELGDEFEVNVAAVECFFPDD